MTDPELPARVLTPSGHRVPTALRPGIVILASGAGSTAAAVIRAAHDPSYPASVVGIVTDRAQAGILEHAHRFSIPTATVRPADFPDRATWDGALTATVSAFRPRLVLSAGFMRILGPTFLARFGRRTVNTHPALLPAFPGAHAVRDALAYGVAVTGCTLHVVDAGTDTGPIIDQRAVTVDPADTEHSLHERIKTAERAMLVTWCGRLAAEGFTVQGRRVLVGRDAARAVE